jgi:hypothetical protein
METGADVEYEGTLTSVDLESSRGKKEVLAIYTLLSGN